MEKDNYFVNAQLDLYFQRNLKNNQLLIVNVVGTYIGSKSNRIYQEERSNVMEAD
jgi:hypothetical protein